MAITEAYPNLKANTNFLALQTELAGTENKIACARQFFNNAVQTLSTTIESVPPNLIAGLGRFRRTEYFESRGEPRARRGWLAQAPQRSRRPARSRRAQLSRWARITLGWGAPGSGSGELNGLLGRADGQPPAGGGPHLGDRVHPVAWTGRNWRSDGQPSGSGSVVVLGSFAWAWPNSIVGRAQFWRDR